MNKKQIIEQIKDYLGINALAEEVRIYLELKAEIAKTSFIEGASKSIHGVIKGAGFAFLGLCVFLFLNLMLGFGISEWFFKHQYWTGFGVLTGFYTFLAIIFAVLQPFIKKKVEEGVEKGVKGSPLELKTIPQILHPNSTTRENIEKGIMKDNVRHEKANTLSEGEAQKALEEQINREEKNLRK